MKNKIVLVILLILLGIGTGLYFMKGKTPSQSSNNIVQKNVPQGEAKMMTLKELMDSGKTQQCSFDYLSTEDQKITGTSFISGKQVRGDFDVTVKGKTSKAHMIIDGSYMYNWSSDTNQGMKIELTEEMINKVGDANSQQYQQLLDEDAPINYTCTEMKADASMFVPPADVTFTDYSEQIKMMQQIQTTPSAGTNGMPENKCSICDSLPTDNQAACRTGLGCE